MSDKAGNDQILDLWASGRSATIVADELGISRNCVIGVVFRARKKGDPRAVQRAPHWDGRVPEGMTRAVCCVPMPTPTADLIRPLAAAGYTCSEIARRIDRSYHTVSAVARYHRIRLCGSYGPRAPMAVDAFIRQSVPEQKGGCVMGAFKYDRDRIADMWAAGKTAPEIAAEFGIPSGRRLVDKVLAQLRKDGDPRAVLRNTKSKTADRIRPLAAQGLSRAEIGAQLGIGAKRVSQVALEHGIAITGVRRGPKPDGRSRRVCPDWVPNEFRPDYARLSRLYGEEKAASTVRKWKAEAQASC